MAAKKRPSVLIFQLSDIDNGEYRAGHAGVSGRIIARPFYLFDDTHEKLYDRTVKKSRELPAEPKLPKAEDDRGYAFLDELINEEFVNNPDILTVLRPRGGYLKWYAGWHHAGDIQQLRAAFSAAGFRVLGVADLHDDAAAGAGAKRPAGVESRDLQEALRFPDSIEKLDLSQNDALETLPDAIGTLKNLKVLDLSFTSLKRLPDTLAGLKSLRELELSYTKLRDLPGWLSALPQLRRLSISSWQMKRTPAVIGKLKLEGLKLAVGTFGPEDAAAIAANRRLESLELELRKTSLRRLPPRLFALPRLRELQLKTWDATLTDVSGFERLKTLRSLGLTIAGARTLPDGIGALRGLETLYLQMPDLKVLPRSLGKLARLREVEIWRTPLRELPADLTRLRGLTILAINEVPLERLPDGIGRLTKLGNLRLHETALTSLPEEIASLRSLAFLDISDSPIASLPASIGALTALSDLNLARTKIAALSPELLRLPKLAVLSVNGASLDELPPLGDLKSLQYLQISDTAIAALPDDVGRLEKLEAVSARNTKLAELPAALSRCPMLRTVALTGCTFTKKGFDGVLALEKKLVTRGGSVDRPRLQKTAPAAKTPAPVAKASSAGLAPAVLAQLARLGCSPSSKRRLKPRTVVFPGGRVPLPEAMRRLYDNIDWRHLEFAGSVDGDAFTDLRFGQHVYDLAEYECIHHRPYLPVADTLTYLKHFMLDLADGNPTDPKVYMLGPAAFNETEVPVKFKRLSDFLKTLTRT
jgi:Leucine-rich repeat (LRR) protein